MRVDIFRDFAFPIVCPLFFECVIVSVNLFLSSHAETKSQLHRFDGKGLDRSGRTWTLREDCHRRPTEVCLRGVFHF